MCGHYMGLWNHHFENLHFALLLIKVDTVIHQKVRALENHDWKFGEDCEMWDRIFTYEVSLGEGRKLRYVVNLVGVRLNYEGILVRVSLGEGREKFGWGKSGKWGKISGEIGYGKIRRIGWGKFEDGERLRYGEDWLGEDWDLTMYSSLISNQTCVR